MSITMMLQQLLTGFSRTLLIFVLTLVFSLPLGLIVYFGRNSRFKPLSWIVRFFISILRGTPLMLQLLVVCFGPYYLFHCKLSANWTFIALILGFVINYAAYFAEIYRSGIESISIGQYEAAEVLGYSKSQTFLKIILPQMFKITLPSITNEVITLVKDTSLSFVLAYAEMFTLAKQISAAKTTFMPLFVAGLFYFIFNAVVAWIMAKLEKSMDYYR
jgi:His/Glu/Gln/Arg/opine family amino acid ABC transporter permease subunit